MEEVDKRILSKFGANLKKLRNLKGTSQEEFAEIVKLDRTYISSLERGKKNPSLLILVRLANSLNVNLDSLLDFSKEVADD